MVTVPHETDLAAIRAAVTEDKLFQRAVDDVILAVMRHTVGLSIRDATVALEQLRAVLELEKVNSHEQRQRPTLRLAGWRARSNRSRDG
jgi:hypothetical protein